jgi:hypothetical protein
MSEFRCEKCDKKFACKRNLLGHYDKKIKCIDIHSNNQVNPNDNEKEKNIIIDIKSNDIDDKQYKSFVCIYCNSGFSRADNLNRHIAKFCNVKNNEENQKKEDVMIERETIFRLLIEKDKHIDALMEENKKKDSNILKLVEKILIDNHKTNKSKKNVNSNNNTNSNNNNSNNNTVNIQITQFGKEEFDIIDDKHFQKIVRDPRILGLKVPEEILKLIHFNPDYPQFNNFYVSDFNREKVMVHDGKTWNLGTLNYIQDALDHVVTYGKTKLEEYGEKPNLTDEGKSRLKRIDDAIKKCDEIYMDELKEKANEVEHNKPILDKIKDCEEFVKKTKENIKNIAYNKGKTIKSKK